MRGNTWTVEPFAGQGLNSMMIHNSTLTEIPSCQFQPVQEIRTRLFLMEARFRKRMNVLFSSIKQLQTSSSHRSVAPMRISSTEFQQSPYFTEQQVQIRDVNKTGGKLNQREPKHENSGGKRGT